VASLDALHHNASRVRNTAKLVAGIDPPEVGQAPKDLIWSDGRCELWRYRSDEVSLSPPLLFVFSLVSRSFIIDLQPGNSFVEQLQRAGFDVFLLDWAPAGDCDAYDRLEDYADVYLPEAVRRTIEAAGSDSVNLLGYCFSGILNLLYAARHLDAPLRSLTNIATPIDFSRWGLLTGLFKEGRFEFDKFLDDSGNIPGRAIRQAFRLLQPTSDVKRQAAWLEHAWNDQYVRTHRAMSRWMDDHVPFPGGVARQTLEMLARENAFVADRVRLGGEHVSLSDIRVPHLTVIAERDHLIPPPVAAPLVDLVGSRTSDELRLDAGHIGLVVGRTAAKVTVPAIIGFMKERSDPATGVRRDGVGRQRDARASILR
jgi:polyhydroxyalkanoate synthase